MKGKNRKITLALVYDLDNVTQADKEARKGKGNHYGVRKFDRNREKNIKLIAESIKNRTYKTMKPIFEERHCDRKTRVLAKIQYTHHVAHHAFMRVIMPILERSYYHESAASIKGRGIHYALKHLRKWVDYHKNRPIFWAQVDFTKCYHNIVRQKLYDRFCKTFSDEGIRWMCHDILWSMDNHNGLYESDDTRGVGIGLYPIQPLVNYYFNDLDRLIASYDIYYARYCDNLLFVGHDTKEIWKAINGALVYIDEVLDQPAHKNIGIQRLDDVHPIDFVGYLVFANHTLIRNDTKNKFKRKYNKYKDNPERLRATLASYKGWLEHCDGLHLWQTVTGMRRFSDFNIDNTTTTLDGKTFFDVPMVSASFLVDRTIIVKNIEENAETRYGNGRMCVLVEENDSEKKFVTNNPRLKDILIQIREQDGFPFEAKFRSRNISNGKIDYYFE